MGFTGGVRGFVDLTGMFARRFQIPNLLESGATFFCGNQYGKAGAKDEAAGKTCRKMDSYMVKLPKVAEELDGGGDIPVPRELRNGKK